MNESRKKIKQIFDQLKISQAEFAKKLGITESYVSKIFRSKNDIKISKTLIKSICYEFNIEPEYFNPSSSNQEPDIAEPRPQYQTNKSATRHADLLNKTREILESGTYYAAALTSNIIAFHDAVEGCETRSRQAVKIEKGLQQLNKIEEGLKRLDKVERDIERLKVPPSKKPRQTG